MKFDCVIVIGALQSKNDNISFYYNSLVEKLSNISFNKFIFSTNIKKSPSKILLTFTKSFPQTTPDIKFCSNISSLTNVIEEHSKILLVCLHSGDNLLYDKLGVVGLSLKYPNVYLHPKLITDDNDLDKQYTEDLLKQTFGLVLKKEKGYFRIIGTNMQSLPFLELQKDGYRQRVFKSDTPQVELVWHRDKKNRYVAVEPEYYPTDWMFQLDNQPPINFPANKLFIPKETYHRLISGTGDLKVRIWEDD